MIDPVTARPAANDIGAAKPVSAPVPVTAPRSVTTAPPDLAQTSGVARALAASAPVDADRVATIRKAIAEGRFPILPATIADRLIALKLQWNPDEPAGHD